MEEITNVNEIFVTKPQVTSPLVSPKHKWGNTKTYSTQTGEETGLNSTGSNCILMVAFCEHGQLF
jgi:hypothetical protein